MLQDFGIESIFHYTPLHYLPFICRHGQLRSKLRLKQAGFEDNHFRTLSRRSDEERGFGQYIHLAIDPQPPILAAKLKAGFPHVELVIPAETLEATKYSLCRFNVAMTRKLKRDGKPGHKESCANGKYYAEEEIPTARKTQEKKCLLQHNMGKNMIEVLVRQELPIDHNTTIVTFHDSDFQIVRKIIKHTNSPLKVECRESQTLYDRNNEYVRSVECFVEKSLLETDWRGNGIEFDSFR